MNVTFDRQRYLAFVLGDSTVDMLRRLFPPRFPRVLTHHVTLAFDVTSFDAVQALDLGNLEVEALALVHGEVNGEGIEAFLVSVNNQVQRLGLQGKYHVTHSLTPPLKPVDSNKLLSSADATYDYFNSPLKLTGRVDQLAR